MPNQNTRPLPGRRDTSRDGFANRFQTFALTRGAPFWSLVQSVEPLRKRINVLLINSAIDQTPPRPFPYSTVGDFTSWVSLRDRTWSARHLPPAEIPGGSLPPLSKVVDLFRRPESGMRTDPKSSVLFTHFAQWFTDGFLTSDRSNMLKNRSNHDIDLTPVYGRTEAITSMIRSNRGGKLRSQMINGEEYPPFFYNENGSTAEEFREFEQRGEFKEGETLDEFEQRGGFLARAAFREFRPTFPEELFDGDNGALTERRSKLFAFGRGRANNQIGFAIFSVLFLREHNRICDELARAHPGWNDERLFQTARNILIVLVLRIAIEEYINHITPYHFKFGLDAPVPGDRTWYRENHMSIEFNLLYRWHPLVPDDLDVGDRKVPLQEAMYNNQLVIERGLGRLFDAASRQPAGEVGLFNTTKLLHEPLRVPESGIALGRQAKLAPYNDYRERFGFPRVTSFEQITADPRRLEALRELYGSVDRIEFFVGLFAEDVRPNAAVGPLVGRMVAVDAFSQALTNPLLNGNIFRERTFSKKGLEIIESTRSIADILNRNIPNPGEGWLATLTRPDWRRA